MQHSTLNKNLETFVWGDDLAFLMSSKNVSLFIYLETGKRKNNSLFSLSHAAKNKNAWSQVTGSNDKRLYCVFATRGYLEKEENS